MCLAGSRNSRTSDSRRRTSDSPTPTRIMISNRRALRESKQAEGRLMARESNRIQDEKRRTRPIPEDTLLMRAKSDAKRRAKGQVLREGVSWSGDSLKPWRIIRSVHGRINQVDLIVGEWTRTGSMRSAEMAVRYGRWPAPRTRLCATFAPVGAMS